MTMSRYAKWTTLAKAFQGWSKFMGLQALDFGHVSFFREVSSGFGIGGCFR